jgi:hypothetical protein
MAKKAKVILLDEFREKRRQRYQGALMKLLLGVGDDPAPKKVRAKVAIPYNPKDKSETIHFSAGLSDGFNTRKYRPPSSGAGYSYGYLNGIVARDFNALVNRDLFVEDVIKDEIFDDELEKLPAQPPKLSSKRIRDVCMVLDMMRLEHKPVGGIISDLAERYDLSKSMTRRVWDDDKLDFTFAWIKPVAKGKQITIK